MNTPSFINLGKVTGTQVRHANFINATPVVETYTAPRLSLFTTSITTSILTRSYHIFAH